MRAIVLPQPDEQIHLHDVEVDVPECANNELLVKVEYVGLNPVDANFAKAGFCEWQYPHILGLDAVELWWLSQQRRVPPMGERVMWHANIGGQREY
ncbi:hypothetical protein ACOBV8_20140 (plasmid) [Pseudoalteromonas espejiana]